MARWSCGRYSGVITIDQPGGDCATHSASLSYDGKLIVQEDMLVHAAQGGDVKALMIAGIETLIDWGSAEGEDSAEHTCAWLVREQKAAMVKHFPALVRWLRADGRSVEDVALDWEAEHRRYLKEKAAHAERQRQRDAGLLDDEDDDETVSA